MTAEAEKQNIPDYMEDLGLINSDYFILNLFNKPSASYINSKYMYNCSIPFCATVKTEPTEVLWMTPMDFCPMPKANRNSAATFKLNLRKTFSKFY